MAGNKIKLPLKTSIQSKLNDLCEFVTRKNFNRSNELTFIRINLVLLLLLLPFFFFLKLSHNFHHSFMYINANYT